MISKFGLELLKKFEGFKGEVYFDPIGIRTIGYGHVVSKKTDSIPTKISELEATRILKEDIRVREVQLEELVSVVISQWERDALLSFVFNVGVENFRNSTMRRLLNTNDKTAAGREFEKWVYAGGQKLAGLLKRRAIESILFLGASENTIKYFLEK